MRHFQLEYSSNLETTVDIAALCDTICKEAAKIEAFPLAGIRAQATRFDFYAIAEEAGLPAGVLSAVNRFGEDAGIGRDGGDWSFEFYMEQKHIGFATSPHKITKLGAL